MKKIWTIIIVAFLLASCGTSEEAVITAIAETEAAKPTETNTPEATTTNTLTPTNTSTLTPTTTPTKTKTPTKTPSKTPSFTPTPVTVFNITYETMEEKFIEWTGVNFEFVYESLGSNVYEGRYVDIGTNIYMMENEGNAVGFMLSIVVSSVFDPNSQVLFMYKVVDYYAGHEAANWLTENFPENPGDKNQVMVNTKNGKLMLSFQQKDEGNVLLIILVDPKYTQ